MTGLVVVDGDDTLWETEQLYDDARHAARRIVEAAGVDGAAWEALEREIDVENVARFGLSAERFPTSCVDAYRRLAAVPDEDVAAAVWAAAATVFHTEAPLYPDSEAALALLAQRFLLVLYTKGDEHVQHRRVAQSGLASFFEEIVVTDAKSAASFRDLGERHAAANGHAWSIGNSLRSDILPAVEAGYRAVWVDRHVWEYERRHSQAVPAAVREATSLSEAAAIVLGADGCPP